MGGFGITAVFFFAITFAEDGERLSSAFRLGSDLFETCIRVIFFGDPLNLSLIFDFLDFGICLSLDSVIFFGDPLKYG